MQKLTFTAKYLGKRCSFDISPASGGAGAWHLYVDGYYYGQFSYRERWVFLPQHEDVFTPQQIAILEEQLQKHWEANQTR